MRWDGPNGFFVSDEADLIDVAWVHDRLSNHAYWAIGRPLEVVASSIDNSLSLGLFSAEQRQAGFARFVTDRATFAWLCDVFIDPAHRQHGLGDFLLTSAISHPQLSGVRIVLSTAPERTLYRRHGFVPLASPDRWLELDPSTET